MLLVRVEKDYLKSILSERLRFWEGKYSEETLDVLNEYFSYLVDSGFFEYATFFNHLEFVDNALINDYLVFVKDDYTKDELKEIDRAFVKGTSLYLESGGQFGEVVFKSANGRAYVVRR